MESQQIMSFEITGSVDEKPSSFVFKQLINEAIDNVFCSLGPICRQAIYDYLEKIYELRKDDIPDHIFEFSEALERIFGNAAGLLEIDMMRRLCKRVPQFRYLSEGTLTFTDYVDALNRFVCRK